ncbi:hypothetical protein [Actinoplanes derwentensis]|uniref:Uncharacterized protein n=1 Tax=Actinoplanes derwentensis TaxID=113562 RepID=A0A1H2A5F1_9ACTN|nr:hypothetical protein [Actinoplanes derwentensis]GID90349.1 hypothetical protein Ade03nite_92730 [Actinoplanes derwentensis]SDT41195.1 hypothetical protein SAMN04489716_3673 [Actinoplanes derwentensis]
MNKVVRAIVMSGVAVAAGVTMAAGPASAAPSSSAAPSVGEKRVATQQKAFPRRDRVVGVYRSLRTCDRIGKVGQWKRQWNRYSCVRVNRGYGSDWALRVSSYGGYPGGGYGGHHPGGGYGGHHSGGGYGGHPGGGYGYKGTR